MSTNPSVQPSPRRRVAASILAALVIWFGSLVAAAPALAHAALERSDPAPGAGLAIAPTDVTLWFTEPVVARYSRIIVVDQAGNTVTTGSLSTVDGSDASALRQPVQDDLADGAYTVVWSVYSRLDAHVVSGVFSFTVGNAIPPTQEEEAALAATVFDTHGAPQALDVAARWFSLLGELALFGALLFVVLVLVPVTGPALPAQRFRSLAAIALLLLLLGQLLTAVVQVLDVTGGRLPGVLGSPLWTLLSQTRFGALWLARAVLWVAMAVLVWALARGARLVAPRPSGAAGALWGLALLTAGLLLLTTSLGSHAAAAEHRAPLAIMLDLLHLAGAGLWFGGVSALLVVAPCIAAAQDGVWRRILTRFGSVSIVAGALVLFSGLLAARRLVGGWDGLVSTRYGLWFALKLVLIAVLLLVVALRPTLTRRRGVAVERTTLGAEAALGALIVLAVGAMTAGIPGAIELGNVQPVYGETKLTGDTSLTFRASPGEIGSNEFSLVVAPADPTFTLPPTSVTLHFAPSDTSLDLRAPNRNDPWTFRAAGDQIDSQGTWEITALITWPEGERQTATFQIEATSRGFYPAGFAPPDPAPTTAALALGFGWIAIGLGLAFLGRRMLQQLRVAGWALLGCGAISVVLGTGIVLLANAG